MGPTIRAIVIFYICMTTYTGRCVSQTEVHTTVHPGDATLPTATDASSESTFGPDADTAHQNASATEENAKRDKSSDELPMEMEKGSRKDRPYQFHFETHVELNVRQITRNVKCCESELREFSDSNMTLTLTLGFPNRCIGCRNYHVERAECEIPRTKHDMALGVRTYRDWNCTTDGVTREMFLAHPNLRPTLRIACEALKSDGDHNLCVLSRTCVTIAAMVGEDMPREFLKYYNDAIATGIFVFAAVMVSSAIAVVIYLRRGLHPKPYTRESTSDTKRHRRQELE